MNNNNNNIVLRFSEVIFSLHVCIITYISCDKAVKIKLNFFLFN